jgi:hypothetical protein
MRIVSISASPDTRSLEPAIGLNVDLVVYRGQAIPISLAVTVRAEDKMSMGIAQLVLWPRSSVTYSKGSYAALAKSFSLVSSRLMSALRSRLVNSHLKGSATCS